MPLLAQEQPSIDPSNYFNQTTPSSGKIPVEGEPGATESPATGRGDSMAATPTEVAQALAGELPAEEEKPFSLTDYWNTSSGNSLRDNQWSIGGNTAQSYTFNFASPKDRFNGPVTWTDRSNEYQLNQTILYIERATVTNEEKDFDLGGRFDAFYGTSARFTTESGLEDNINKGQAFYGLALTQFYVEAAYKKVKVKMGHWYSPVGYFVVDTTQNFFNTIPYTYQYGEPFTHTGAIATWQATDNLVLGGGFTRGWDNFGGNGYGALGLGTVATASYTFQDKSNLSWVSFWSREPNGQNADFGANGIPATIGHSGRYMQSLVYSRALSEKLSYVAHSDFGTQGDAATAAAAQAGATAGTARWYGLNQYMFYKQNDRFSWGLNVEWFRDEAGYRVGGFLPNLPNSNLTAATRGLDVNRGGYIGNFYQMTMGPKIQLNKNMFVRPNLRFDWFGGQATHTNPDGSPAQPYQDGHSRHQTILATDLCVLY